MTDLFQELDSLLARFESQKGREAEAAVLHQGFVRVAAVIALQRHALNTSSLQGLKSSIELANRLMAAGDLDPQAAATLADELGTAVQVSNAIASANADDATSAQRADAAQSGLDDAIDAALGAKSYEVQKPKPAPSFF